MYKRQLYDNKIKPRLFKALSIAENDNGTYAITALQHDPNKEAIVDQGAKFDTENGTIFNWAIPPVEQLQVEVTPESDVYQARLSWSTPRTIQNLKFEVKIYRDDKLVSRDVVTDTEYYISDLQQGKFNATVRGVGGEDGRLGDETTISFSILPPAKPSGLVITPSAFNISIRPVMTSVSSLGTQFEFYKGATRAEVEAQTNYLGRAMSMIDVDCTPDTEYWYGVNAVNVVGRSELYIQNTRTLQAEDGAGGIFRIQTADGKFPDNDTATQMFYREFGFYPARDTTLIIYSLGADGKIAHSEPKMYNGSQWIEPKMFIDGDLIATGTMRGDRLIAGTEIAAPLIRGGTVEACNVISSGTPPAFELQQDGTLYARRANISGNIYANSGQLNNVVINENCQIMGKLTAMQIVGDIAKFYTCPKNGMVIIESEPFDRQLCILPVTLAAVGYYGGGHGDTNYPDRWDCGTLDIIIGDRDHYPYGFVDHQMSTSKINLTVCWSHSTIVPANKTYFIRTKTPDKYNTTGIPDFITALVVKI